MTPLDVGSFQLTGVANLPNVTVAFPGEHWSRAKASEVIVPGEAVTEIASGGKLYVQRAASGAIGRKTGIALRTVQIPDVNTGPGALGPNEIMNAAIQKGDYVHVYFSGAFHLTLVAPDATWGPSDLVAWDPAGARPTGKGGTGSWVKTATDANALFSVQEFRPYSANGQEGILTVRSLRTQM